MEQFRQDIRQFYEDHGRNLPWRDPELDGSFNSYKILVSEIMLQQTQVTRVLPKYQEFLSSFPDQRHLAKASFAQVLGVWNGLGYNRRARYLHEAARRLPDDRPWDVHMLKACKGIGANTAAAVCVYAYNQPHIFIETNIRTVFIHHFFSDRIHEPVDDKEIIPLVAATLDKRRPREFYWALMDYGTYLKKTVGNFSQHSRHYSKQTPFEGSVRQMRGMILRQLREEPLAIEDLRQLCDDKRLEPALASLLKDNMIRRQNGRFRVA